MDWERKRYGIGPSTITFIFMCIVGGIVLIVHLVFFQLHLTWQRVENTGLALIATWAVFQWLDRTADEEDRMHEAIDKLEEKLDAVLENQGRIEELFYSVKDSE